MVHAEYYEHYSWNERYSLEYRGTAGVYVRFINGRTLNKNYGIYGLCDITTSTFLNIAIPKRYIWSSPELSIGGCNKV